MNSPKFAIIVQGLFEKGDSIGYDASFEYKILQEIYGKSCIRIFSERFEQKLHKGIDIQPIRHLWSFLDNTPDATVIYHFCDGWPLIDEYIACHDREFVVRWHNNTPPWFYGATQRRLAERSIVGFRTILKLIASGNVKFWVNSNFTLEQLRVLGADIGRAAVVYPGSRFLELDDAKVFAAAIPVESLAVANGERPIRLLFVSRVVAHKGHRHVMSFADALQQALRRKVSVTFIGREDTATNARSDLLGMSLASGVEVLIKGEVTEPELQAAYASTDFFVCFSEHEGFGIPVFEAMRVGIPVICWGRTALRELMQHHPFTLDDLDFARAIAAVRLIDSGGARADILAIQSTILGTYSSQVITSQLKAAIGETYGLWSNEPAQFEDNAEIDRALREKLNRQIVQVPQPAPQPREVGENLVTVYDVESYEALLGTDRGKDRLPPHDAPGDFVLFSHREFVTTKGTQLADGIAFSAATAGVDKAHVIFGPYEKFVRGYFAADFELEVEQDGHQAVELELDVVVEGGSPAVRRRVTAQQLHASGPPRLLFPVSTENAVVEFRISVRRAGNCNFLFRGVTIRNMRQTVAGLRDGSKGSLFDMRWFKQRALLRFRGVRIPAVAGVHFNRADILRDRQWWNDAAGAYTAGLKYHPRSVDHLVLLGNCLKEAGRFEDSETAYQDALSIKPDDQNAHLQVGRLYRAWDRAEEATYHLLQAARIQRVTGEAMLELSASGFDISALPVLFK